MGVFVSKQTKSRQRSRVKSFTEAPMSPVSPCADYNDSCCELKQNLPDNLKAYTDSIESMYRFWLSEIESLSADDYKEAAVLFYMNVFKHLPKARVLFHKKIEIQAKQFFGMFRWLITNLRTPDPQRLVSRIKLLGAMHEKMKIQPEWYILFLQAFHETMYETVKEKYTTRIRFCMEQLYTVVMNIMLNRDFESLSSAKVGKLLKLLGKLEDFLEDDEAKIYLALYMQEQFCSELFLFYQDYRRFRACVNNCQRQRVGNEMMKKYVDSFSECEINVSHTAKEYVYASLQENDGKFVANVFDQCVKECIGLILTNTWKPFKECIIQMAVHEELHYDAPQSVSPRSPYSASAKTRQLGFSLQPPVLQLSVSKSVDTNSSCRSSTTFTY